MAFSHDGNLLATGNASGTIRLWQVMPGTPPTPVGAPLTGPDGRIFAMVFDPRDGSLAVGTGAEQIWLWDIAEPTRPRAHVKLDGSGKSYTELAFSEDGSMLAGAGGDVRLWEVDPARVAARICRESGDVITETEWHKHVADVPYRSPCP
ncbi:WD40 repeat domain-containing protein [Nonomuraea insulae]|uniref:WD40 repeat domain-containing protein n=1 Tax=Nonomuraea insulae TaxID=1616787 RepID=A0ABW1CHT4_9ACTN